VSENSARAEFYAGRTVTKGSNGRSAQNETSRDEIEDQTEKSEQQAYPGSERGHADTWDRSVSSPDRQERGAHPPGTRLRRGIPWGVRPSDRVLAPSVRRGVIGVSRAARMVRGFGMVRTPTPASRAAVRRVRRLTPSGSPDRRAIRYAPRVSVPILPIRRVRSVLAIRIQEGIPCRFNRPTSVSS
jgi:hypothetical protein